MFVSAVILSTFTTVNVPAAGVFAPIVALLIADPSIVPPFMSGAFIVGTPYVLFVSVCVVSVPTSVVVAAGSVIVTFPENEA